VKIVLVPITGIEIERIGAAAQKSNQTASQGIRNE